MQIFVDADACPVVDIIETIAEKYNIPTTLLCDTIMLVIREGCTRAGVKNALSLIIPNIQ